MRRIQTTIVETAKRLSSFRWWNTRALLTFAFVCIALVAVFIKLSADSMENRYGVSIEGIRLSAGGYMLDFRYRILDPHKAEHLVDRRNKAYLIDEATGARYAVPVPGKVGPLRTTTRAALPGKDRSYFVMFANPASRVKHGDKVTVVIGDFRAEHLGVQ
jgi:hypothetical protein